jgi:hypothetical protein
VINSIAMCLMYHWSEKGRDSVICGAFFRTDIRSSQYSHHVWRLEQLGYTVMLTPQEVA